MTYKGGVLKTYASVWETLLRLFDAVAVAVTGILAAYLYMGHLPEQGGYRVGLILGVLLTLVMFPGFGLYRAWRGESIASELRAISFAWISVLAALSVLAFLTKRGPEFSRGWFLIWLVLGLAFFAAERLLLRRTLAALRERGLNQRRIVVVGSGDFGLAVVRAINTAPWTGLQAIALFHSRAKDNETGSHSKCAGDPISTFWGTEGLASFITNEGIDQVWIALPLREEETIRRVLCDLRHSTVDLRYVPDFTGLQLLNNSVSEVAGFPVVNLSATHMEGLNEFAKGLLDRTLALAILILVSPLMMAIAIAVKLSSPGPILFRQRRLGIGGEPIDVLKFRSMLQHEELPGHVTQATKQDPRVTTVGAFLRRTSLDELPQFINVLCGHMSIVGPRPHAIEHNEHYKDLVDKYMLRHKVKPGITGWAQVNGYRGETDTLEKMARRVEHDLHYIENWSIWFDIKIIALTVIRGFSDRNAY